jgi:hypothetical protein
MEKTGVESRFLFPVIVKQLREQQGAALENGAGRKFWGRH